MISRINYKMATPEHRSDDPARDAPPTPEDAILGGTGAAAVVGSSSTPASRATTPLQARAEAMAALTAAAPQSGTRAPPAAATTTATAPVTTTRRARFAPLAFPVAAADAHTASHDLWIYEKDKDVATTKSAAEATTPIIYICMYIIQRNTRIKLTCMNVP